MSCLVHLTELKLSGRVVLSPVSSLVQLTQLRLLEVTQDIQVCGLGGGVSGIAGHGFNSGSMQENCIFGALAQHGNSGNT